MVLELACVKRLLLEAFGKQAAKQSHYSSQAHARVVALSSKSCSLPRNGLPECAQSYVLLFSLRFKNFEGRWPLKFLKRNSTVLLYKKNIFLSCVHDGHLFLLKTITCLLHKKVRLTEDNFLHKSFKNYRWA